MSTLANIHPSEAVTPDAITPTPVSSQVEAPPQPPSPRVSWLREPLLHFVLLGGLLFVGDHFLISRADDPRTIIVSGEVNTEAVETFRAARGRAPNAEELKALHQVWLDNEVLYREGLALQVDRGDTAIRERVIFKALSVVDSNVKLPAIDEGGLRKWFEAHRDKYDEPARYDFDEAALSGDNNEAAVRDFVTQLNNGTPGDAKAGLRVFKGRPRQNLLQSYGAELAEALTNAAPGQWQALNTKDGWRAMRLNAIIAAKPADFTAIRGVVMQDWKDAIASEQRSAAVHELAKKYKIKYEIPVDHGSPE
jgi:PPIC-type PPIASE domain